MSVDINFLTQWKCNCFKLPGSFKVYAQQKRSSAKKSGPCFLFVFFLFIMTNNAGVVAPDIDTDLQTI